MPVISLAYTGPPSLCGGPGSPHTCSHLRGSDEPERVKGQKFFRLPRVRCFNSPPNYKDFFASLTMSANRVPLWHDSAWRQHNVTHREHWRVFFGR